jgi:hypothetical protein
MPVSTESKAIIKQALLDLKNRAGLYTRYERYYRGAHDLMFATEKFRNAFGFLFRAFSDNMMPAVVDAVADKLQVTGYRIEAGESKLSDEAWALWQRNRMDARAGEVHQEALRQGDAYVIVWPDADGNVMIYPNRAALCTVCYDDEIPGKIIWGAKLWFTLKMQVRLNLYFPDRIEKYVTSQVMPNGVPETEDAFMVNQIEGEAWPLVNEYGVVPMFHFANNAAIGRTGNSELRDAVRLQDALNKAVLDMMVAMEFAAFRQRWATGLEIEIDANGKAIPPFEPGVERLWTSDDPDTKFGEFEATDLKQFIEVQDSFRFEIARVTGTPLHYLMLNGGHLPSGDAMKMLETRHIAKVKDRQTSFGNVWEDVMTLALRMSNKSDDLQIFTEWADPAPVSVKELLETLILKGQIGVDDEQLLTEAGYGMADIKKMLARTQQRQQQQRDQALQEFNGGGDSAF